MAKVLEQYERQIESFELIPSGGGRFEFTVDDQLLFSKKETGRHAEQDELVRLIRDALDSPAE